MRHLCPTFGFFLFLLLGLGEVPGAHALETITTVSDVDAYDGWIVDETVFKGLNRIEAEALHAKLTTQKGKILNREQIRADVRAIYDMSYFEEVEVMAEPLEAQRVRLTYRVKERPAIAKLEFEGNEQVSTDDLKEVVRTKEWSILDVGRVKEDTRLIQKHYEDKGYYLAKVNYEVKKAKDGEVELKFVINDYDKVRIKQITFLNNQVFSDDELKKIFMETQEGGFFSFLSGSGSFKETAFKQDLQRLTYWYLDHGYVKFRHENPIVTISEDKKWMYITIYVEEGEQYSMKKLDFSGDLLFPKEELHSELKLVSGDTFGITKRTQDLLRLSEKYQDLGYAYVNVIPNMEVHDEDHTVDIKWHFEKGHLVYFGEINIVGNSKTHDKVIRRELRFHEGELYNGTNFRVSRERVERLGYFQPGEVVFNTIARKDREDIMDVEISIKERSTGTITLGAGYGSGSGPFFTTQLSEINLFGRGQVLSFTAQYATSRTNKSFNLGFTDPYTFDTRWSTGFDVFSVTYDIPDKYETRKLGFDTRFGRPLMDDVNAYITYKNEGMQIGNKAHPDIDPSLDEGVLSSVIWSVARDVRNNRFETTEGNYQSASVETAGIFGDKEFLKWILNNRVYFSVVGDLVFRNSTEVGHIARISSKDSPPSERFFLGGPNNMKGYQLFALGPYIDHAGFDIGDLNGDGDLDDAGERQPTVREPLGGSVEMFSLFELEYPLIREAGLKWVMFFDIGNAFAHLPGTQGEEFTLRTDAGFGIRWFSPIGPLRFEWGWPLKVKEGEREGPEFQFFIGPPF